MILCKDCDPRACCCDFCKHYDFNADDKGRYTGDGFCKLHQINSDPANECDDFHCEHAKNKNPKKTKSK